MADQENPEERSLGTKWRKPSRLLVVGAEQAISGRRRAGLWGKTEQAVRQVGNWPS
ncbi:hypothetical protein Dimus_026911, partial [Dionaea muscipula]